MSLECASWAAGFEAGAYDAANLTASALRASLEDFAAAWLGVVSGEEAIEGVRAFGETGKRLKQATPTFDAFPDIDPIAPVPLPLSGGWEHRS